jgi:hypothetical protein
MVAGSVRPHGRSWLAFIPCVRHIPICCGCIALAFSNGGRVREASSFLRDSGEEGAIGRRIGHVKGLGKNVHVMLLSDLLRRGLQKLLVARAHMATRQPSAANASAVARAIP